MSDKKRQAEEIEQLVKVIEAHSKADKTSSHLVDHSIIQMTLMKYSSMGVLIMFGLVLILGGILLVKLLQPEPPPQLVATLPDGSRAKLLVVDKPNLGNQALFAWAAKATQELWTMNFVNEKEKLESFKTKFTGEGYTMYSRIAQYSSWMRNIVKEKESLKAVVVAPPLLKKGPLDVHGYRLWIVEVPFKLEREALGKKLSIRNLVNTMLIVYDPLDKAGKSFAIQQIKTEVKN